MQLLYPSYEIMQTHNNNQSFTDQLKLLEKAGRVCYKSENLTTETSYEKFISKILFSYKHESVIEHSSLTVRFIIDRGVSHELVRHRLASYSQESTRYCNYTKSKNKDKKSHIKFIIPPWVNINPGVYDNQTKLPEETTLPSCEWSWLMLQSEISYFRLINEHKQTPQKARSVLPNSLKTEIIVTANFRQWRHIFKLRTHESAHPQMRQIMIPLLKELSNMIPIIFDDLHGICE